MKQWLSWILLRLYCVCLLLSFFCFFTIWRNLFNFNSRAWHSLDESTHLESRWKFQMVSQHFLKHFQDIRMPFVKRSILRRESSTHEKWIWNEKNNNAFICICICIWVSYQFKQSLKQSIKWRTSERERERSFLLCFVLHVMQVQCILQPFPLHFIHLYMQL